MNSEFTKPGAITTSVFLIRSFKIQTSALNTLLTAQECEKLKDVNKSFRIWADKTLKDNLTTQLLRPYFSTKHCI